MDVSIATDRRCEVQVLFWRSFPSRGLLLLMVLFVLTGCGEDDFSQKQGTGDSTQVELGTSRDTNAPASNAGYREINVTNGGTISGRVTLGEGVAMPPDFDITSNAEYCADAAKNNRLQIGPDRGVAWGVVRIEHIDEGKSFDRKLSINMKIDQFRCRYSPHVVVAPVGMQVRIVNNDPVAHNVRIEDTTGNIQMNVAQPNAGDLDLFLVESVGPHLVGCDYHPWMNAYVFGVDNPYFAVTGEDGVYRINEVPPGTYQLTFWMNGFKPEARRDNQGQLVRYGYSKPYHLTRTIQVAENGSITEDFVVTESDVK